MSNYVTLLNSDNTIDTSTQDSDGRIYDVVDASVTRNADGVISADLDMLPYTDVWRIRHPKRILLDSDYWYIRRVKKARTQTLGISIELDHISYILDVKDNPDDEDNMDEITYNGYLSQVIADIMGDNPHGFTWSNAYGNTVVSYFNTTARGKRKRLLELAEHVGMYIDWHRMDFTFLPKTVEGTLVTAEVGRDIMSSDIEIVTNDVGAEVHNVSIQPLALSELIPTDVNNTLNSYALFNRVHVIDTQFNIDEQLVVTGITYNPFNRSQPQLTLDKPIRALDNVVYTSTWVVNSLNNGSMSKPLSAKQGMLLNQKTLDLDDTTVSLDERITALEDSSGGGGGGDFPFTVGEYQNRPTENLALLSGSVTGQYGSIAIGQNATSANYSVVLGRLALTSSNSTQSVAVGSEADNRQQHGVAIGHDATVQATSQNGIIGSIAIGASTIAQTACIAIGKNARAYWGANHIVGSVAFGYGALAERSYSASFGYGAKTFGQQQFATTNNTAPNVNGGTALGAFANNTSDRMFVLGNGTSVSTKSNAFSVGLTGDVYGGTYNSTGADLAEYFEWDDGNAKSDDRRGLAVTLVGDKIRIAQQGDDVIGIISATASVIGDAHDDYYHNKYAKDKYGAILYEDVINDDGDTVRQPMINPDYDVTQTYVPRSERKEWGCVGLIGKLIAHDDGSLVVGNYADVGVDGRLTRVTHRTQFRVMSRLDDDLVLVLHK